jgi:hypothetical protein
MKLYLSSLLLIVSISFGAYSQELPEEDITKRIYTTKKLTKVPVIDGDISDEAWDVVEWSSEFVQKTPNEGKAPSHQTKFKVIYDEKYLYIAIVAFDEEPELIQQRLTRRDGFAGDRVNVIIDSYHDKRTTLRLNYSINPNMSIQFYGQPYIARGRYSDFNYVTNSTASSIDDRVQMYDANQISENNDAFSVDENSDTITDYTFDNPDFSYVQFRTNLVARWEYIPGSELFFVWARGGSGYENPRNSLSKSLRNQIIDRPLEDTFLIKATYRFVR